MKLKVLLGHKLEIIPGNTSRPAAEPSPFTSTKRRTKTCFSLLSLTTNSTFSCLQFCRGTRRTSSTSSSIPTKICCFRRATTTRSSVGRSRRALMTGSASTPWKATSRRCGKSASRQAESTCVPARRTRAGASGRCQVLSTRTWVSWLHRTSDLSTASHGAKVSRA